MSPRVTPSFGAQALLSSFSRLRSTRSLKKLAVASLLLMAAAPIAEAGGWYVANTSPTEWVRYQRVYFSAGTYRFTARAGSPVAGSTIHLEIDNVPVQTSISVPNTGRADAFTYVHLGTKAVSQGYHDVKIVFGSANVSLDWFMLSKDSDTTASVKPSDITMVRPDTEGMLIAPVVAFGHVTGTTGTVASLCRNYWTDDNLQRYSDAQIEAWYGIPLYQDFDRRTDRYWDNIVEELMASRAQVPLVHCRETKDFTRNLQDRDYQNGPGHFEGRWLVKFAEAVARNPQAASSLKIGMFWENGGIADLFKTRYGYYPSWGDPALVDYVMTYHLGPWFDSIPPAMLYQPVPGQPVISLFANHPDRLVNDGKMADFVAAVRGRLQEKYGLSPVFVLPKGGDVDAATEAQGWGQCPWGTWSGPMLTPNTFKGTAWGTTCAGSRRRLDTVWLNDWNPVTNTGTPAHESPGVDNFRSRRDSNGNSVLLTNFAQAKAAGMRLVQQEGFTNMAEGNSLNRSYHPGWGFPNQHIAAMREYADPTTQTAIFEAEGCDDYFKVVNDGNSGGSYRSEWYSKGNHLDVYRPLHNLQNWGQRTLTSSGGLTQISAGTFDVWGLTADGKVWARHVTGLPNSGTSDWRQVTNAPALSAVSVSKEHVWGLAGTTVYSTTIPHGWQLNENTGWVQRGSMVQISTSLSKVWGVNASGQVFHRPVDGSGNWTQVAGTMNKVFADESFVWGMNGSNISFTRASAISWTQVANPHGITQIAVGGEEVWGINASGQVFRRSVSGIGGWDAVTAPGSTLTSLSIGEDYVWGLAGGTPYACRMEGFQGAVALPPFINNAAAGNGQATLTWTAVSGATGYHIKRATTSGGPYTTALSNVMPVTAPLSVTHSASNGTMYYYVVSALTPGGETANSEEVQVLPQATVPPAPGGLTATKGFDNAINLGWTDQSSSEAGFRIERQQGSSAFVPIAVVPRDVTTYSDPTALSGVDYSYRVCAFNAAGSSSYTNTSLVSTAVHQLSRAGWTATVSAGSGSLPSAFDNNPGTRWSTGTQQVGGEWFRVDMGRVNTIYQIDLWTGSGDYPGDYKLELSLDGTNWGSVVTAGTGLSKITTLAFAPQAARYVRITQTGTLAAWWSINEFNIYGQPGQELNRAGWTMSASISPLFASNATDANPSTRWTTGSSSATGQWFQADLGAPQAFSQIVLDQGTSANDYPAGYQVLVSNDGVNWSGPIATGPGTPGATIITFPQQVRRFVRVVRTGAVGSYWSIHEFQVYGVPVVAQTLSRGGWAYSASASAGSNPPANAGDGNTGTRWSTGAVQANGQWFQVDFGTSSPANVGQLLLDSGAGSNDYARGYQVKVSNDGTNWGNAIASGSGVVGTTPINLAPQIARYLRVYQTGSSPTNWWSLNEVNALGSPVEALVRTGWTASASATGSGAAASNVLDGNTGTRWNSGAAQTAGQWFKVDFGALKTFSHVVLDAASSANDFPRGYNLEVSNDNTNWTLVGVGSATSTLSTLSFPRQTARYLRITLNTGIGNWWTIYELNVYDAPTATPAAPTSLSATGANSQVGLTWTAVANATTYTVKRATTAGGPYSTIATGVTGTSFVDTGLTNGLDYYYTVSATNNSGSSAESVSSSTVTAPLQSPWQKLDIGAVGVAGNAYYVNPVYTLVGSGSDISGGADAFRYLYQTSSGDCSIIARVTSQENTHGWAKAGVMLRETAQPGAINAAVLVSNGAVNFQWRSSTGASTFSAGGGWMTFPNIWVKLTRTGNVVSAHCSTDGVTWTQVGTDQTLTMATSATIGLAVTSHANTVTSTATFDNVVAKP